MSRYGQGSRHSYGSRPVGLVIPALFPVSAVLAAETITYTYDARGRLKQVVRSGTVNNGVSSSYTHDKADNRTNKTTTGAPPPP